VVANRYRIAPTKKPEILRNMVKRASNHGFFATYILGDAWFGTVANIKTAKDNNL
jgi:SRSO17 transposase